MISTGDTAFVLKQHAARTASASGLRRRLPGLPCPCVSPPRRRPPNPRVRRVHAHGLKG